MRPSLTIRSTPLFPGELARFFSFLRIGHAQAKRLHISVELRNRIEQIVYLQNRQAFSLEWAREYLHPSRIAASNLDPSEIPPDGRVRSSQDARAWQIAEVSAAGIVCRGCAGFPFQNARRSTDKN